MSGCQIIHGDSFEVLKTLDSESVQCCVTSPPYFGLRSYGGGSAEIGQERSPAEYVARLVAVFSEVKRVLKKDGTLWLNLGDSYSGSGKGGNPPDSKYQKQKTNRGCETARIAARTRFAGDDRCSGYTPKNLIGIPWRVAFALQAGGWTLRSDIIWAKANCMPESVPDRPTRSHEFIFLLSKSPRYFYDSDAIKEPCIYDVDATGTAARKARANGNKLLPTAKVNGIRPAGFKDAEKFNGKHGDKQRGHSRRHQGFNDRWDDMEKAEQCTGMRNKRDVWTVAPANYPEAHFATFPPALIKPCILAGSRSGDTVLDPFFGSGTTGQVSLELGRACIGIELNPAYCQLARERCNVTPGLHLV